MDLMQPRMVQRIVDVGIANLDFQVIPQTGLRMVGLALLGAAGGLGCGVYAALAGAERVFELMDEIPEMDVQNAMPLEHVKGEVRLEGVNFGYEPGVPVLKNVHLHAHPGQMVALVGPTGAGKTTIANLLTRFYDVDSGAIYDDGQDVCTFKKDDLRRKVGLVLQDNFLFADTCDGEYTLWAV